MKRILFVDDEPRVLDGLRRMLRPQRNEWDMAFALGGEAALDHLGAHEIDVIVCDMRMPKVDGLTVLRYVREHAPQVIRIVLSGQTDLAVMSRSVHIAHQFLAKPCEPATLKSAIERVCEFQTLVQDPRLLRVVGQLGELPVLPRAYAELSEALENPETSMRDIVRIVERDIGLAARCLQITSSAFYGLPRRVTTLDQAVSYIGTAVLRDLVLTSEVFSSFKSGGRLTQGRFEWFERHACLVANLAKCLLDDRELSQQAFLAGMLHDLGRMVIETSGAEVQLIGEVDGLGRSVGAAPAPNGEPGISHAEIGAYLLGLWGLPHAIVEAVAYHHRPEHASAARLDVVGAVYIANLLAHEVADQSIDLLDAPGAAELLNALGVEGQVSTWRALAAETVALEMGSA